MRMTGKGCKQAHAYTLVGQPRNVSSAARMTGRVLEANCFVYVQKQLAHCVGREVTALLTGKQRTLWICEAYIGHCQIKLA